MFTKHWRQEKGFDLYPVLRLILPQKDRERAVYGLKEKNLAKIYIKLIPLGRTDVDAVRLLNWKKPTVKDVRYPARARLLSDTYHVRRSLETSLPSYTKS